MFNTLEDYRGIIGDDVIAGIHAKARRLLGRRVLHVNSTYQGGGVAELLASLVPLTNDAGVDADWRILLGTYDFFDVTKRFHNALQGGTVELDERALEFYEETNRAFAGWAQLDRDVVIVHDPQPLPLIRYFKKRQPWVWRCHIDLSDPDPRLWHYLKGFILRYDVMLVSHPDYLHEDLPVPQRIVHPAIDPLAAKNIALDDEELARILARENIPLDKPLMTQVSRFDPWKDPLGVVEVFKKVREEVDCRLVLCGSMASDDPEGFVIYEQVAQSARELIDSGDVIVIAKDSPSLFINALQRVSSVILQKSTREGFGLTVAEAMWKGKPVVASHVGGIPLQITHGKTGFLVDPRDLDDVARVVIELLRDPELRDTIGAQAREAVREKFLITRLLSDYLDVLNDVL
ncbi:MAG: glycosyltransferase [Coriobacteriia bacterium]|nr:glycosyltransferase [Anaerosomatales bacterium]